ncbi:phosphoglycerate mutase, putative, partial [Ixodes scapularis]
RDPESCVKPAKNDSPEQQNRYNEALQQHKPTAIRHLYLIRHGQYNLKGDSDRDLILTELGRKQADVTGQRLKQLNVPFSRMVFSTMARATETARIIHGHFEHLPLEPCELIREGAPIPPEPPSGAWKPEAKVVARIAKLAIWTFQNYFCYVESDLEVKKWLLIKVCQANRPFLFVACDSTRALQFPPEGWLRFSLTNCSISVVSILPSGRVLVRTVGDSGHLPKDMITTN